MPGRNIYGELWRAQLERLSADPSSGVASRVIWNTTEGRAKYDTGSAYRAFLANDDKLVIGNNATANNNVRINRSAASTVQFLLGGDTTVEGSAASSSAWGKVQSKLAGCLVDDYVDFTEAAAPSSPAASTLRLYATTGEKLAYKNSAGTVITIDTTPSLAVVSKTANYTATTSDNVVLCDATGAAFTIILPTAVGNTGKNLIIVKTDSTANIVTIDGNASETIDGSLTVICEVQYERISIVSNGTNWNIVSRDFPAVSARATFSGSSSTLSFTANGTAARVDFDTVTYDSNSGITTGGSWVYTAKKAGVYSVSASINITADTYTVNQFLTLFLYKNGSLYSRLGQTRAMTTSSVLMAVCGSDKVSLAKGDTIDIRVACNQGGTSTITTGSSETFVAINLG